MLDRILETEVMDSDEEALDYDRMDHAAVNRAFVEDFLSAADGYDVDLTTGSILDLGTGTAQIPIVLCQRSTRARVIAVDAARSMLALARKNVLAARCQRRIELARVDAKQLPYADGVFCAVMSNSIVHHIPEPVCVFREAVRVARRGALLFFRDLLRPADEACLRRLVANHASEANSRQRRLFADSLRAALTLVEVRELVQSLGFARESAVQTSDRHWTWMAVKR
jgi:ubiquinone/menaquinone biosynthesis C-methylase UbiE